MDTKTQNTIYKKLFTEEKLELESHKIELGLIDDLKKLLIRMKSVEGALAKSTQKSINSLQAFSKVQGNLKDSYQMAQLDKDDAKDEIKIAVSIIEKISKQAKDLGINPSEIKGTKEVVSFTANIEDTIAILQRNESDINKILSI